MNQNKTLNWQSFDSFVKELIQDIKCVVNPSRKRALTLTGLTITLKGYSGLSTEDLSTLTWKDLLLNNPEQLVFQKGGHRIRIYLRKRPKLKLFIQMANEIINPSNLQSPVFAKTKFLTNIDNKIGQLLECYGFNLEGNKDAVGNLYSKMFHITNWPNSSKFFDLLYSKKSSPIAGPSDPRFYKDSAIKILVEIKEVRKP